MRALCVHGDGAVGADLLAGAALGAVGVVEVRQDGRLGSHHVLLRPVADIAELIHATALEVFNGSIALAVHESGHAVDAVLQDADAAGIHSGAQTGDVRTGHQVTHAVVPGEDTADAADGEALDGAGGLQQLGQGEQLPGAAHQAADSVGAAVEGAGLMVDPRAVERIVGGDGRAAGFLDGQSDGSLVDALGSTFINNGQFCGLRADLADVQDLLGVHGQGRAHVQLGSNSAEGGVRAAGVELDGVNAQGFHILDKFHPGRGIFADTADGADEHDVVVMAQFEQFGAFIVHPLLIGDVAEHLGADPGILHFGTKLFQAVEVGAGPMMGTVDLMNGFGSQPTDALVDHALGIDQLFAIVTGRHADGVLQFIAQKIRFQICHTITSIHFFHFQSSEKSHIFYEAGQCGVSGRANALPDTGKYKGDQASLN